MKCCMQRNFVAIYLLMAILCLTIHYLNAQNTELTKVKKSRDVPLTNLFNDPERIGLNQEQHVEQLLSELVKAEAVNDTAVIIRRSILLSQAFRRMLMNNRAKYYIQNALKYGEAFSCKEYLIESYFYAGVVMTALGKYDSAFYYQKFVIKNGPKFGNPARVGWAYKQLLSDAIGLSTLLPNDTILLYYNNAMESSKEWNDPYLANLAYATLHLYLERIGDLRRADSLLQLLSYRQRFMNTSQGIVFYENVHTHLARVNGLDTLIKLRTEISVLQSDRTASTHRDQLYAKDQEYGVSKTKIILNETSNMLSITNKVLISSAIVVIIFLSLIAYLFFLFRKNKKLSERNELLLREQNHRVKNNLQMISSLLSLQSQKLQSSDAKAVLEDSQGRISSVALLHRMLYEGEQVGHIEVVSYLKSLTEEIKYGANRVVEVELNLPERLELKVEKITSLGLIVNELFTNSIKHVDFEIQLQIGLQLKQTEGQLYITYSDNGVGVSPERWLSTSSFGNQLIQLQSRQLRGEFEIRSEAGFKYDLRIPA
jgi:two-component sensor histidine kinase